MGLYRLAFAASGVWLITKACKQGGKGDRKLQKEPAQEVVSSSGDTPLITHPAETSCSKVEPDRQLISTPEQQDSLPKTPQHLSTPVQPFASEPSLAPVAAAVARAALYSSIRENDVIVHELLLQDIRLDEDTVSGTAAAQVNPVRQVREIAEAAFWDALAEGLHGKPIQWERLAVLVADAKQQLLELIPATSQQGQDLRAELAEKLESEYVSHRLHAGFDPGYLQQLFDFLMHVIMVLEAPARSQQTRQGYAAISQRFQAAAEAPSPPPAPQPQSEPITIRLQASSDVRVPVQLSAQEAWLPVELLAPDQTCGESQVSIGAPLEEVQVRLGQPVEDERVAVTLRIKSAAAPTTSSASVPGLAAGVVAVLVEASKYLFDRLGQLRKDVAQARLTMLKGLLQGSSSGVQYEQRRYALALEGYEGPLSAVLSNTWRWLEVAGIPLTMQQRPGPGAVAAAIMQALLNLVQAKVAVTMEACPETLLLDCRRIVAAQNELQRVSLTAAALLIAQQLLAAKHISPAASNPLNQTFFSNVRDRFSVLLASPDINLAALSEEMASLLQRRCTAEAPAAGGGEAEGDAALVGRMLSRIFSTEDTVYQRVQRGIIAALQALLLGMGEKACVAELRACGAQALLSEVRSMAAGLGRLLQLNQAVCTPYYTALLTEMTAAQESSVEE